MKHAPKHTYRWQCFYWPARGGALHWFQNTWLYISSWGNNTCFHLITHHRELFPQEFTSSAVGSSLRQYRLCSCHKSGTDVKKITQDIFQNMACDWQSLKTACNQTPSPIQSIYCPVWFSCLKTHFWSHKTRDTTKPRLYNVLNEERVMTFRFFQTKNSVLTRNCGSVCLI